MPYDLSQLDDNTATCTSPLGITVTYRLKDVTPRVLRQMDLLATRDERTPGVNADALVNVVTTLVRAWDVTDHGEPVALTADALADVRLEILGDVVMAIVEDANGGGAANPTTGTASRRR